MLKASVLIALLIAFCTTVRALSTQLTLNIYSNPSNPSLLVSNEVRIKHTIPNPSQSFKSLHFTTLSSFFYHFQFPIDAIKLEARDKFLLNFTLNNKDIQSLLVAANVSQQSILYVKMKSEVSEIASSVVLPACDLIKSLLQESQFLVKLTPFVTKTVNGSGINAINVIPSVSTKTCLEATTELSRVASENSFLSGAVLVAPQFSQLALQVNESSSSSIKETVEVPQSQGDTHHEAPETHEHVQEEDVDILQKIVSYVTSNWKVVVPILIGFIALSFIEPPEQEKQKSSSPASQKVDQKKKQ